MKLHFHPSRCWMNDPNGLVQYGGVYHMFYQYNPHGNTWGDIHWGHAVSRDLYAWQELPIALTPDHARREQHCFSGSCCKDAQGRPHFFYTSIGWPEDGRSPIDGAQQWMAEPVDDTLTTLVQNDAYALKDDMHGDIRPKEWRDPCVIPYGDGYLMVLGGSVAGRGCVLLYTSKDMIHWQYQHILAQSDAADDMPWECPNLFFVDGKAVLFYSPCQAVRYQVGTMDEALHFHVEHSGVLDPAGNNGYYAPQILRDDHGRCILMGWMPECDGGEDVIRRGWNGCMALPRLLSIVDGDLHAELLPGWQEHCLSPKNLTVNTGEVVQAEAGSHYILQLTLTSGQQLQARLLMTDDEQTTLTVAVTDDAACLALDRTASSVLEAASQLPLGRTVPLQNGQVKLTICVDGNAVEVGANGFWLSARAYPQGEVKSLTMGLMGEAAQQTAQLFIMR